MTMQIKLNGQRHELPIAQTVAALIESLGLTGKRYAIELNDDILPRSQYSNTWLAAGDRVEIVHAVGGG